MLRSIQSIEGYRVTADQHRIGRIKDAYFDDGYWRIRYFVADAAGPLSTRDADDPAAFEDRREIYVQPQVTLPPNDDENELPVSSKGRRDDTTHDAYGWPHRSSTSILDSRGSPVPFTSPDGVTAEELTLDVDPHLRSVREIRGYTLHGLNGEFGHVVGFLCDDEDWSIRFLVGSSGEALPEEGNLLISPSRIRRVDWEHASVHVDLTLDRIREQLEADGKDPS